jgi:hypothetical protein
VAFSRELLFARLLCVEVSFGFNAGGGSVNIDSMSVDCTAFSSACRSVDPVGVGGGLGRGIIVGIQKNKEIKRQGSLGS